MTNDLHRHHQRQRLLRLLPQIQAYDGSLQYEVRHVLILEALAAAAQAGYRTGYRIDPQEPEWPVAFIELPQGQISWHMPQFPEGWDGHTVDEKYERIRTFLCSERLDTELAETG